MDNRRFLVAALLSALVLIVWNALFIPPPAAPPAAEDGLQDPRVSEDGRAASEREQAGREEAGPLGFEDSAHSEGGTRSEGGVFAEEAAGDEAGGRAAEPLIDFATEEVAAELETSSVLESDLFRAEFTNRGAQLISLRLRQHRSEDGEELELVKARGSDPYPFALVSGGLRSHRLNGALFTVSEETDSLGEPLLRFRHRGERGAAEKVFRLEPSGLMSAEVTVVGENDWSLFLGPGLRNVEGDAADSQFMQRGVGYRQGEELELVLAKKQKEDLLVPAFGLRWLALEDSFFLFGVVPGDGFQGALVRPVLQRDEVDADKPRFLPIETDLAGQELTHEQFLLLEAAGERLEVSTLFGAKRYSRLSKLPYGFEDTVRWGWFGFLAKPLYFGLEWIYAEVVANYGWAIVLITLVIKLLFFPLTHKSQESMSKMQELNPKVQAIRTKYRSKLKDKSGRPNLEAQRQMNEEVMSVYKNAGVNPASGCLPLLLQMPVFFAFFRVLSTAVELRDATWIGWIKDLSGPDPYFILPLLMGATSVAMQKMMPAAPDPMQRRLMQLMPIVFTVFALYFPSGLVLYWVTNNLLTMGQQALLQKMKKRKAEAEA